MRFVSVRELRSRSAAVWARLKEEGEVVVTSNGKPIAVLTTTSEETLEASIAASRQARATAAVAAMQQASAAAGRDRMPDEEIEAQIQAARAERRK